MAEPSSGRSRGCGFFFAAIGGCFLLVLILLLVFVPLSSDRPVAEPLAGENLEASLPSGSYTVKAGDTLSAIADRHRTTVESLAAANGLVGVDQIEVGQRLSLADGRERPMSKLQAPARKPPTKEPPARPEGVQAEIRRSTEDPCRYYFVSLTELDEDRIGVLTRQHCPTSGDYYERIEMNCESAEFRYVGSAAEAASIVSRPSDWIDLVAGSAKDDTVKFACAKAGRTLGDRPPGPLLPEVSNDAELHTLFMDCSARVSAFTPPVVQKRCFDIGSYLHDQYIQQERFGSATRISDRMEALGWWGWIGPRYRLVR